MNNKEKNINEEEINIKKIKNMWKLLIISTIFYVGILLLTEKFLEEGLLLGIIVCISTIVFVIIGFISLKLEVEAGYYECQNCNNRFVPSYKKVLFSPHMFHSRYLKCPRCHKKSWTKKVMTKNIKGLHYDKV